MRVTRSTNISLLGALSSAAFGGSVAYIGSYYYFSVQANKILSEMNNNKKKTKRIANHTTATDAAATTSSIIVSSSPSIKSRVDKLLSRERIYITMNLDSIAQKTKTIFSMFAEVAADTFKNLFMGGVGRM